MSRRLRRLAAALALLVAATVHGRELQPFDGDSLAQLQAQYRGRPFMLTLWSLGCHHCVAELRTLGQLVRKHRQLPLVVVSTDTREETPEILAALKRHGLDGQDIRVFSDPLPDRLRYRIDPDWHGELPRSYLFDADHRRTAHSGRLEASQIEAALLVRTPRVRR